MRFPWMTWRECFAAVPIALIAALGLLAAIGWFFPSVLLDRRLLVAVGAALWIGVYLAGLWFVNGGRAEEAEQAEGWRRHAS